MARRIRKRLSLKKRRIGVALGGGGTRGLAHVGVIRALRRREEFLPKIIAGTSAGSIVATLYAGGLPQSEIEENAKKFNWFRNVISFSDTVRHVFGHKQGGLISNATLGHTINELIGYRNFNDLEIDLAVIATDIENRRRVIFTSQKVARIIDYEELFHFLPEQMDFKPGCSTTVISDYDDIGMAVRASCAVPGIFQPVEIRDMQLLDGGLIDQVPVDVIRAMGANLTIGVSLSLSFLPEKISNAALAIGGTIGILGVQQLRKNLDLADIGFQISGIDKRSSIDPDQLDLIDIGEKNMNYWLDIIAGKAGSRRL